jgi:hypothetical protein
MNTTTTTTIQDDYFKRHPSKNSFSLETLILNKFIRCELVNRPIVLRSKLPYSFWIETDPIKKEYKFFTMNRNIVIEDCSTPIKECNTYHGRIQLRKYYEKLINKDFIYHDNKRIEAPHRIFISTTCNNFTIQNLRLIVNQSLMNMNTIYNQEQEQSQIEDEQQEQVQTINKQPIENNNLLYRWNMLINSIYHSITPIDSYYCIGDYPRHDEIFIQEYLTLINAIGKEYVTSITSTSSQKQFNTLYSNKILYAYKYSKKMNIVLFDKSRTLYYVNSKFMRLSITQLKMIDYQFYECEFNYDYCYTNIINTIKDLAIKDECEFKYEFSINAFHNYIQPIIDDLGITIDYNLSRLHNKIQKERSYKHNNNDNESINIPDKLISKIFEDQYEEEDEHNEYEHNEDEYEDDEHEVDEHKDSDESILLGNKRKFNPYSKDLSTTITKTSIKTTTTTTTTTVNILDDIPWISRKKYKV